MDIIICGGEALSEVGCNELERSGNLVRRLPYGLLGEDGLFDKETEKALLENLKGCEALVYSGYFNENAQLPLPIYDSFYNGNITPMVKLIKAAKASGVKRLVILGSYFSYFAKRNPRKELYKKHPYIRSCIELENVALSHNDENFNVIVLELPYIYGNPLPEFFDERLKRFIVCPKGGTAMITQEQMGRFIACALEKGTGASCYPVGMYNIKWTALLKILPDVRSEKGKKVIIVYNFLYKIMTCILKLRIRNKDCETGLNPAFLIELLGEDIYIVEKRTRLMLGVEYEDVSKAISFSDNLEVNTSREKGNITVKLRKNLKT